MQLTNVSKQMNKHNALECENKFGTITIAFKTKEQMDEFDQKLWYLVLSISWNEDRDTQEEDITKAI